jgi:predicted dehydrogenase
MERGSAPPEKPSEQLGVLVVGAGGIANEHLRALHSSPNARLAGIVDVDPGRAAAAAHANGGARWSANLADALAWPEAEACVVCTPNHTHATLGLQIAEAGKHLLIEKPLATTVEDADRLLEAFANAHRVLMAAHTHRHYDYARAVKAAIDDGTIGRPVLARFAILGSWIWPDWRAWMIDPVKSGGHSLHNGVHLLDLVTWWFGEKPATVYVRGQRQTGATLGIYDYLEMTLRFENGAVAICEMSRGHRPANIGHRDVLVAGTKGELALPWDAEAALAIDERGTSLVPPVSTNGFTAQLEAFLAAIRGEAGAMSAEEGRRAVVMGVAAERSIRTGLPVQLAELTEEAA